MPSISKVKGKGVGRVASVTLVAAIGAVTLASCDAAQTSAGSTEGGPWAPTDNVTLVIHADAGGSSDMMGREVAKQLSEQGIVEPTVLVENRPGGSGAVAYNYILSQAGNPNILATLSSSYLTTPVTGQADYTYEDFSNVAVLGTDALVLAAKAGSGIESLDDLITKAEENPGEVVFAGTQTGGGDSIVRFLLEEETGVSFRYVAFEGGSEVNAAVLGGNADVMSGNPAEIAGLVEAGDVVPLAVTTPERLDGYDVPTMAEEGFDVELTLARGILAPPNLTPEQEEFWESALETMAASDEWQAYLKENMLFPEIQIGDDADAYLAEEWKKYEDILGALGLIEG